MYKKIYHIFKHVLFWIAVAAGFGKIVVFAHDHLQRLDSLTESVAQLEQRCSRAEQRSRLGTVY